MGTVHLVGTKEWARGADEQGDPRARLGEWLRRARESRGLTLDGVMRETRIPRRHLEAIEHGDLDILPEFYQRAEIRAIARAVGLDEEQAIARLQLVTTPVQPPATPPKPAEAAPRNPFLYGTLALAAVAIVLAAFAGGAESTPESTPEPDRTSPAEITLRAAPAETPQAISARPDDVALVPQADPVPPPAANPDAVTELVITTQPSGARVTVNGIGWGTSPIAIKHLPPGDKRIRVSKDGYSTEDRVLALGEGGRHTVSINLTTTR